MNIQVHLYKDSDCDLCKLMQQELTDNPPNADVHIHNIQHSKGVAYELGIKGFPTIIIMNCDMEITRRTGFITSETIDSIINDYETESVV